MLVVMLTLGTLLGQSITGANPMPGVGQGQKPPQAAPPAVPTVCGQMNIVPSPNVGSSGNDLYGVSALASNDVWAVGNYINGSYYQTLVEHWDGAIWSLAPIPNVGSGGNNLLGVSALASNDVWAVGYYLNGSADQTLVEHWDGAVWSVVTSPNLGSSGNYLYGVSALASNDVWAVGHYLNGSANQTLVEHWNGAVWSVVTSPNPGSSGNYLYGVSALASNDVWAVGDYLNGTALHTLVEHWDGAAWSVVTSPNLGSSNNFLSGVSALASNDVWAVGYYLNGSAYQALVEHWNGAAWSVVTTPYPGSGGNKLFGVSALPGGDVWAVGYYGNPPLTLVEKYGGPCVTPTPTDTPVPTDCPNPFVDVSGNIFYTAIHYLYCRGVVNGADPTHYSPAGTSTRAQFAKVVVLGFGLAPYTPTGGGQDFTDVPPSYFAYLYIETGYHNGILSGFAAAGCTAHGAIYPCYLPNIPITRAQLTKLVVSAAHYPLFTPTGGGQTFSDVPPGNIFYAFIETAHQKGVINGYPDGTFRPNNNIRRDEMAQIVYKGVTTP